VHSGGLEPFLLLHIVVRVSLTVVTHGRFDGVILVSLLVPIQKLGIFSVLRISIFDTYLVYHQVGMTEMSFLK
jgi:hypothetical protein